MEVDFKSIEEKWQNKWEAEKTFEVSEKSKKPKFYCLEMFPYPSGSGLHMGHAWNYTIGDIIARFKILNGFNVLHPMGYDALGLPAENAAIKEGVHPAEYTDKSIANYIKQQKRLGLSYDWSRMVSTADPSYYKWDQWIFLKMFEKGLAYQKESAVNWCPKCETVLANEQVVDGKCWRHDDTNVEIKHLKQWFLKTTEYADELYEEIKNLDWPDRTKAMQKNWIGKSHGTEIDFLVNDTKWPIFTTRPDTIFGVTFMVVSAQHPNLPSLITPEQQNEFYDFMKRIKTVSQKSMKEVEDLDKEGVFTGSYAINPATGEFVPIYAGNFVVADYGSGMVMAVPAHDQRDFEFAKKYGIEIKQVVVPCKEDSQNPPREGMEEVKRDTVIVHLRDKSTGKFALLNWHETLEGITTAIMGGIEEGQTPSEAALMEISEEAALGDVKIVAQSNLITAAKYCASHKNQNRCAHSYALLAEVENLKNQGEIPEDERKKHTLVWVDEKEVLNKLTPDHQKQIWQLIQNEAALVESGYLINSGEFDGLNNQDAKEKITDWLAEKGVARKVVNFRLRDWGISRQRYWGTPIPIVHCEKCGAVPVPEKDLPIELPRDVKFGEGNPLESADDWINVKCPACGGDARRETDTMDTFVNSSWYYLRYCDPQNDKKIFDSKKADYWCPVDTYIGGAEHACMHLIYVRFYTKFLADLGLIDFREPAKKLFHQGMLRAEGGEKMSKSKGNVVLPEVVSDKYGIDTARFFLASLASPDKDIDWSENGIAGSSRFINKIFSYFEELKEGEDSDKVLVKLNKTIANVEGYYENFEYRKATIELRELFDLIERESASKETLENFLILMNPLCPHITEELWERLGHKDLISTTVWPKAEKVKEKKSGGADLTEKVISELEPVLEKHSDKEKVYVYVMPFELDKIDSAKISDETGKTVSVFAVSDKDKHDPEGKAKKAKPGKASFYLE